MSMSMSKPTTHQLSPSTWPEHPFTLIATVRNASPPTPHDAQTIHIARLMALTHNTIFRAFNAIYTQSSLISPSDVKDLLLFTKFTLDFLSNHHKCEELVFFPMLDAQAKKPGLMKLDVEQHKRFEGELVDLQRWVGGLLDGKGVFDASELRGRIGELAEPVGEHLREEIGRLLEVGGLVGGEVLGVCYRALHDEAEGTTDGYGIGPLVLGCQDRTLRVDGVDIQFPVLPFKLAPYLVEHIVSRRYAGAWRFCPSTFHGEVRETEFFKFEGGAGLRKEQIFGLGRRFVVLLSLVFALAALFVASDAYGWNVKGQLRDW